MLTLLSHFLMATFLFAGNPEKVFVQSQNTQLKQDPKGDSANVTPLNRGDELVVLKREGLWIQVQTLKSSTGWIPKILTSTVKPMAQSQILKDTANLDSTAKTSRRRTTDYNVSAATRGLSAEGRHRPGDEVFRSNRQAVEELEKLKISPESLETFKLQGHLEGK